MTIDTTEGQALKDEGMALVSSHTADAWKAAFAAAAADILHSHGSVTSEEVVAIVGKPPGHPNAVGAAMSSFAKRNHLTCSYEKATATSRHRGIIGRWFVDSEAMEGAEP